MGLNDLIQFASQAAAKSLVSCAWQGAVLAAALWICLKLTPRTTSAFRFKAWSAVFAVIALLPFLRVFAFPHTSLSGPASRVAEQGGLAAFQLDTRWAVGIALVWLTASLVRATGLLRNAMKLLALWRRATPVKDALVPESLLAAGESRRVQLCTTPDLDQPSAIGFFSPRVLIPDWLFDKLTREELDQIVLHEMEHLRRGDDWINLLQKIALVIFPLNPALAWVEKRLCAERELACDEAVLRSTHAPREYASCLTSLAEKRMERRAVAALSLGAWDKESELSLRVQAILGGGATMRPQAARAVLAVLVLASSVAGYMLSGSPALVSFTTKQDAALSASAQTNSLVDDRQASGITRAARFQTARFEATPGLAAKYNDAVFHPDAAHVKSAGAKPAVAHRASHAQSQSVASPAQQSAAIAENGDGVPVQHATVIVFTQWEVTMQQGSVVNLVDDSPRNSPRAVARVQGGWIVIQL